MKKLTSLLFAALTIYSVSALAESFEMNGVIQSVDLARSVITIDDADYLLPNRVTDSNSNAKSPAIYQLEEGAIVRIVGTVSSPMNQVDALAILPHDPVETGAAQGTPQ
ncbi:PilY2 family type 4a fimbrial biogenesis protein [Pseudomonas sp. NPDC078700]|uniref:PilY2 family type 4a fimbrial biogenesis protein n=1 Tax=Pseudomonas sp. NPDC078700 TaxID=3364424 RepID=UPI0037CB8860